VRSDGTQRSLICEAGVPFGRVSGGAWLSDGRIVFRGLADLMVVSANGGTPGLFISADAESLADFHEPTALPQGEGMLVIRHGDGGANSVGIYDLEGHSYPLFTLSGQELSRAWYSPSGHVLVMHETEMLAVPVDLSRREVVGETFSVLRDAAAPSVSSDGTLVYVRGAGAMRRQPVLVDREGVIQTRLGRAADLWAVFALSPDGTRALSADNVGSDLWLHDVRGARIRASFTGIEHDMACFSPDGQSLYFATGTESNYRIGRKSVDGNEPEEELVASGPLGPAYYGACPTLSSDGRRLFYTARGEDGSSDIAWLDLDAGAEPQIFLSGAAMEFAACPSPQDDRYVAYVSDESGTEQVYLTTWPDAGRRMQVSIEGGLFPHWKGDGSELYFARGNEIYAVSVSYDPVRLGRPELLFSRPEFDDRQPFGWPATYDVSADGQLFLVTDLVVEGDFNPHIAIVENWASTLAR
jgi:hypothetical protein